MASDYYRLLKDAMEKIERLSQPSTRVNRSILEFVGSLDLTVMTENMTVQATAGVHPAQWGTTTTGPGGANWQWDAAGGWG